MKYMSKRRVTVNKDELIILLMNDLSELAPELARFSAETVEQLKKISNDPFNPFNRILYEFVQFPF